jgi:hypothetical protein
VLPVALAALIAIFDADMAAIQEVNGPVPVLQARADQKPDHISASACSEPEPRSMVARRLQYVPVVVHIPPERYTTRRTERTGCRPAQLMKMLKAPHAHG